MIPSGERNKKGTHFLFVIPSGERNKKGTHFLFVSLLRHKLAYEKEVGTYVGICRVRSKGISCWFNRYNSQP